MGKRMSFIGMTFGRLLVVGEGAPTADNKRRYKCVCGCGNTTMVRGAELSRKKQSVVSCGCVRAEVITSHGRTGTRPYRIWRGMLNRCTNSRLPAYKHYGGRGVTVCERWKTFENFFADMGDPPNGMSIDRIDNNGNYEPSNCRWATQKEQRRNTRTNRVCTVGGVSAPVVVWAEKLHVVKSTIYERLARGWSIEDACTRPIRGKVLHIRSET